MNKRSDEQPESLDDWLEFISRQNVKEIELGLGRIGQVAEKLCLTPFDCPTITVAGTNGKGSSITALEMFYNNAGYKTACYTSPHLTVFNERIRLNKQFVSDVLLCNAFSDINAARGNIALTYFEFATLAAFLIFQQANPDVVLLEVGLGGRLDATNLFAADIALITRIGIDHVDWLGNDRETIAIEKAGIIHQGKIVIISDEHPPRSLLEVAERKASQRYILNQHYSYTLEGGKWCWNCQGEELTSLPLAGLSGKPQYNNLAGVLMCISVFQDKLPINENVIRDTLPSLVVSGRFQVVELQPQVILDVAHNPDSVELLAENLRALYAQGKTHAVVAMLNDKDIDSSILAIHELIDSWFIADLDVKRAADKDRLRSVIAGLSPLSVMAEFETVPQAFEAAKDSAKEEDRIVVFGSFHTVGAIIDSLSLQNQE